MTIIALDPGQTTGVAELRGGWHVKAFEVGPHPHHSELYDYLSSHVLNLDTIVCEGFRQRYSAADLMPVEYIGVVKLFVEHHFEVKLVMQQPAAKTFGNRAKLKAAGLYHPGEPHANDATSHLLAYLAQRDELPQTWLEAWR